MVGNRPETLSTFRVTTGDPEIADKIAEMYGGIPEEWETRSEDFLQVLTDRDTVSVVIPASSALTADLRLYGLGGVLMPHCDGRYSLLEENHGELCGCPERLEDRKAFAKTGRGPKPYINLNFRLADAYDLGLFRFLSHSWKLAEVVGDYAAELERYDGPVLGDLALELVEYTTKSGRNVCYRKPTLNIRKAWDEN